MDISTGYSISPPTLSVAPAIVTGYSIGTSLSLGMLFGAIVTGIQFFGRMTSTTGAIATGRYRH